MQTDYSSCSEPRPTVSTNDTNFQFDFSSCLTPVVNKVSRQNGTTKDDIVLSGRGFSEKRCASDINFGDYMCKVTDSSFSTVTCNIEATNQPRIGRPQYVQYLVRNVGFAQINISQPMLRSFTLYPSVTSVSPTSGSTSGHTQITIRGIGFPKNYTTGTIDITIGGYQCDVVSSSYTKTTCFSPGSYPNIHRNVSVSIAAGHARMIPAKCERDCTFTYTKSMTPTITHVSPLSMTGENTTTVTLVGTGFGENISTVRVSMKSSEQHSCTVTSVSDTRILCEIKYLPQGSNTVIVDISGKGRGKHSNDIEQIESIAGIFNVHPDHGSLHGGTDVTITGNGFKSDVIVRIDGIACEVIQRTLGYIVCTTAAHSSGVVGLTVTSNHIAYPYQTFNYTKDTTPTVIAVSPSSGTSGQTLSIRGHHFGATPDDNKVLIGKQLCTVISASDNTLNCTVGHYRAGTYFVKVNVRGQGRSNGDVTFTFNMTATSILPRAGTYGCVIITATHCVGQSC